MRKDLMDHPVRRRRALQLMGAFGVGLYLGGCLPLRKSFDLGGNATDRTDWPMHRGIKDLAPQGFASGDFPSHQHAVLWAKENFLKHMGGILEPTQKAPLVIVGGGMAGLAMAYLLRDQKPFVLEQDLYFGGNSKGESWRGIDYSIGAAYFIKPDDGSALDAFVKELGILDQARIKSEEGLVEYQRTLFSHFWHGETDPKNTTQFKKIAKYFRSVLHEENGSLYPEIPYFEDGERSKFVRSIDAVSFYDHVKKKAGGTLHPHIETLLEQYCWSSFGGSSREVSAATGLNFFAAEFAEIVALPGGNAALAERLMRKTLETVPQENLRSGSLVVDVRVNQTSVLTTFIDASKKLKTIASQAVVMACPKFIVAKLVSDLEKERKDAIQKLRYRSYLVANAFFEIPSCSDFYDLYMLGDGKTHLHDTRSAALQRKVTDVVLANYARPSKSQTVLTLYRGIPYDRGRAEILDEQSHLRLGTEFETQIEDSIAPLIGLPRNSLKGIRMTRWGHPLPLSEKGLICSGVIDRLRKPFKERIFFVEQDNWMLPALETVIGEALHWTPHVRNVLGCGLLSRDLSYKRNKNN